MFTKPSVVTVELDDAITRTISETSNIALQKTVYVRFWVVMAKI
jgi:hypothetical protein